MVLDKQNCKSWPEGRCPACPRRSSSRMVSPWRLSSWGARASSPRTGCRCSSPSAAWPAWTAPCAPRCKVVLVSNYYHWLSLKARNSCKGGLSNFGTAFINASVAKVDQAEYISNTSTENRRSYQDPRTQINNLWGFRTSENLFAILTSKIRKEIKSKLCI